MFVYIAHNTICKIKHIFEKMFIEWVYGKEGLMKRQMDEWMGLW